MSNLYKLISRSLLILGLVIFSSFAVPQATQAQTVQLWSNPATWGGQLPNANTIATIADGQTVQFDVNSATVKGIDIQHGGRLIFKDQNFNLTTGWIIVHGYMEIGTESTPFLSDGVITFVGTDTTENVVPFMGTKGILVHAGNLEMHGDVSNTSWARINQTAPAGATSLVMEKNVDWQAGDRIVITSTDYDPHQAEELTVTSVNGSTVNFTPALQYKHFGELQTFDGKQLDERAEVALLTRNIKVQGGEDSEAGGFGAHIMAMKDSIMRLEGVELYRMGQKLGNRGILGRYALHSHMAGDVTGNYVKNLSIHHTYNRCITIHGTDSWLLTDNVCYDAIGHMYFFEDAAERFNVLERNIGILAKTPVDPLIISDAVNGFGPAVFWISNPTNTFRGNVAAGSEGSGFWYDLPAAPTGLSTDRTDIQPRHEPFGEFTDNVAHSIPSFGFFSEFMNPSSGGDVLINNFTVYKVSLDGVWSEGNGPLFGGGMFIFNNGRFADNRNSILNPGFGRVRDSLFVGESANKSSEPNGGHSYTTGISFYDGPFGVENSTFANYIHYPEKNRYAGAISWKRDLVVGVAHENFINNLNFLNANEVLWVPQDQFLGNHSISAASYPSLSFWDKDGTLTGVPYGTVSNPNPMSYTSESTYVNKWNAYINPHPIAKLAIPCFSSGGCKTTIKRDDGVVAYVGSDGRFDIPVNRSYTLYLPDNNCNFQATFHYQLRDYWAFFEVPYTCSITNVDSLRTNGGSFSAASSIQQVRDSQGGLYFHDQANGKLYFKLYQSNQRPFEGEPPYFQDGIRLTGSGSNSVGSVPTFNKVLAWSYDPGQTSPTPTPQQCRADINQDNIVDVSDYSALVQNFLKPNFDSRADLNGDSMVDISDYSLLVADFLTTCP